MKRPFWKYTCIYEGNIAIDFLRNIYIYICMGVCVCVCVCERERERERKRERERITDFLYSVTNLRVGEFLGIPERLSACDEDL